MNTNVITNNVPRTVLDGWELTTSERQEFDYLDWDAIERGDDSRSFVRYKGQVIDLGDLGESVPSELRELGWHNWQSDGFYSGLAFRWADDFDSVVVATVIFS